MSLNAADLKRVDLSGPADRGDRGSSHHTFDLHHAQEAVRAR